MKRVIDVSEMLYETCSRLVSEGDPRPSESCIANSEPYGPQGDRISREALKSALNYIYDCAYIESKSKEGIVSDIIAEIDNAPTIESDNELKEKIELCKNAYRIMSDAFECEVTKNTRPTGEWRVRLDDDGVTYHFYCSCCGREVQVITDYCPYCGAKMEEPCKEQI